MPTVSPQPLLATAGPGTPSRKRLRRRVSWALALAGLAVVTAGVITAGFVLLDDSPSVSVTSDTAELKLTRTRLGQIKARLEGVTISSKPAELPRLEGCSTDSGDLFQPSTTVGWKPGASNQEATLREVAAALAADGWTVSDETPGGDRQVSLRSPTGWTASGFIYSHLDLPEEPPYVGLEVRIDDATPCSAEID